MAFDPAADPWGAAMLAAAAVVALAVFVLVAAILTGTPKRSAGRILGFGCALFLGAAVGGTWVRVQHGDADAARAAKPKPEPVTIVAPAPPPDPDDPDAPKPQPGVAAVGDAGGDADADGQPTAIDDAGGGAPDPAVAPPTTAAAALNLTPTRSSNIDTSPVPLNDAALPTDEAERTKAIANRLRAARTLAADERRCADAPGIAQAWADLSVLPADTPGLRTATAKLEACRKRIRNAKAYWVRRERIEARNAYAEELPGMLKNDDSFVFVNVRGNAHERIRIGGKSITDARVQVLLDGGLATELTALGFTEVTFASGKGTIVKHYDVDNDAAVTTAVMGRWGLGEKLSVAE